MRRIALLPCVALLLAIASCSAPERPKTTLSIITGGNGLDTLGIVGEVKGLLSLTASPGTPNRSFTVMATGDGDTLKLAIQPELTDLQKGYLGELLDTLSNRPSTWSPAPLTLFYKDNAPEVVELLQLDTLNGYPLEIDYASAQWTYREKPTFMTGPLASGAAASYLLYRLKQPLPSSSYALGLADTSASGHTDNEAADLFSSILSAVGPTSVAFTINSEDAAITPLWDSLRTNHRLLIDSIELSLVWANVEFPYREFSRYADRDTMITSSIDKLRSAPPYIFHALVAPQLSGAIKGYRWDH